MIRVGIPRALSYYRYFPFWKTLLEGLGVEVSVSSPTSKKLLEEGVRHCVDDICVPVKLYYGHVMDLKDRVDRLFVSRIVSVEKASYDTYTCPKLIGLPDMIRSSVDCLPPIVEFVVDVQNMSLRSSAKRAAAELGICGNLTRQVLRRSLAVQSIYESALLEGLSPQDAIDGVLRGNGAVARKRSRGEAPAHDLKIALVGHEYLIHDYFISHDLPAKLRGLGAEVVYMTQVSGGVIEGELEKYPGISWSYEKELLGAASHFMGRPDIDGVMMVMGFACGPDSIISEIIIREVRSVRDIPYMTLVLDEHTGEAGVATRVEAFVDMIRRSRRRT